MSDDQGPPPDLPRPGHQIASAASGKSIFIGVIPSHFDSDGKLTGDGEEHLETEIAKSKVDRPTGRELIRGARDLAEELHSKQGGGGGGSAGSENEPASDSFNLFAYTVHITYLPENEKK